MALLGMCIACPSKDEPATPVGTKLIEWKRGPTVYSTGVSLGDDIGPPIAEEKTVVFQPESPRNGDLGEVRLSLRIERGEVRVKPNAEGQRPAEQAAAPRTIDVALLANGGWKVSGACEPAVSALASLGARRVGVAQRCSLRLQSGNDSGGIHVIVRGDGKIDTIASFGKAELL